MEWIETTGKTLNDALDLALDRLGIHKDELEYEVLDEGKKGVFGIGGTETRIKSRVKPISREKPKDRKTRGGARKTATKKDPLRTVKTKQTAKESDKEKLPVKTKPTAKESDKEKLPVKTKTAVKKRTIKKEVKMEDENNLKDEETSSVPEKQVREYGAPIEDQAKYAEEFLAGVVKFFDDDVKITSTLEEDSVTVAVEGNNVGLLIGTRGTTLFAVEELMRAVVQAKVGGYTARMYLDMGGYRETRKKALTDFANDLVKKVKETGRSQVLEPMVASDRKVIHDTISEIDGMSTTSEGYDPKRRVVVMIDEA